MVAVACFLTIFCVVIWGGDCRVVTENEEYLTFPSNFLLGASTSAYQIEGGWNASDKTESVWDHFVHDGKNRIYGNQTGDVACDSYHKFREDVSIIKDIGFNAYRFSLSWPRILPTGFSNKISRDGLKYYHDHIDELLANNIEPIVTIFHWDHPQVLEDAGGWVNEKIVDWFGDYARIVFREFGNKVKKFLTINEPFQFCTNNYARGIHAPGKKSLRGIGEYLCVRNVLKAHARAYRIYEREFKTTKKGSIGIVTDVQDFVSKNGNDTRSVEIAYQFNAGWILHPLYFGDYPQIMKDIVAEKSSQQGYLRSRLPEFTVEEINYIKGTVDFLAINHYTTWSVDPELQEDVQSIWNDMGFDFKAHPTGKSSASYWLKDVPKGFGNVLRRLSVEYNHPEIYVTENGISDDGDTNDIQRINYFHGYLKEMLLAINRDGVKVRGYMLWSLLDDFEWDRGYSEKFGIIHVNFNDPSRQRTYKKSANWWKQVIQYRKLQPVPQ